MAMETTTPIPTGNAGSDIIYPGLGDDGVFGVSVEDVVFGEGEL